MKRCPQCDRAYTDESQNFCLIDGSPLVETDSEPTVVIPQTARPTIAQPVRLTTQNPKKSRLMMYLAIAVLVIFLLFAGMALALFLSYGRNSDINANITSSGNTNAKPTPTPTKKPSPSPTASPSPTTAGTPAKGEDDSSNEVVPIAWDTVASGFKGEPGKIYKFDCPKNGNDHAVYGSDVYADYSSICTAAVHAGVITLESGGTVTLEYKPGRQIYGSTDRNGIKSGTASENARSFVVR